MRSFEFHMGLERRVMADVKSHFSPWLLFYPLYRKAFWCLWLRIRYSSQIFGQYFFGSITQMRAFQRYKRALQVIISVLLDQYGRLQFLTWFVHIHLYIYSSVYGYMYGSLCILHTTMLYIFKDLLSISLCSYYFVR